MIYYKTNEEIELLRAASLLVSETHVEVSKHIRPGIKTKFLDQIAEEFIRDNGAIPAFKGYSGFPFTLCISVNEEVVHGFPSDREIVDGDVLSVDCGTLKDDFYGDSAFTYPVGDVSDDVLKLLRVTCESLFKGIENAVVGKRLGDIGAAVQEHTEKRQGYGVVRDLVGHGIGRSLHEEPQVPNYGKKGRGMLLKEGLVLAIEPMINMGTHKVKQLKDGWTIVTADKTVSAHFEHSVAIKKGKADILSNHDLIFSALKNNSEIKDFR